MEIDCGFWDKDGNYKKDVQEELQPFKDDYFKGLDNKTIAELAKKSIRITAENSRLENCLQEIKKIAERQLLVTNVRTYQMVYYADFSQYRNEILNLITKTEEE